MQITHVGGQGPLWIEALDAEVAPGETVEPVDDTLAMSLLDQPDNWAPADSDAHAYVDDVAAGVKANADFAAELAQWNVDLTAAQTAPVKVKRVAKKPARTSKAAQSDSE